jgi:hypothetical protein
MSAPQLFAYGLFGLLPRRNFATRRTRAAGALRHVKTERVEEARLRTFGDADGPEDVLSRRGVGEKYRQRAQHGG